MQPQEKHLPDDPKRRVGQHRHHINVDQEHKLRDWAQKFNVADA